MKYPFHVFKFGGASVRHASAIRKVSDIVRPYQDQHLLVVVSAMGKTTNALERVVAAYRSGKDFEPELSELRAYHLQVMKDLFPLHTVIWKIINDVFDALPSRMTPALSPDQLYDQVVSQGEVLSTHIVTEFLSQEGLRVAWIDAQEYIRTDSTYREGKVDWAATEKKIQTLKPQLDNQILVTQGFVGGDPNGYATTLGREGSDYTAAIFGSCLPAVTVTIWKDVPGVMNADPKRIAEAVVKSRSAIPLIW